ncbi:MAG: hypothetical protein KAT70_03025, partial [Thermoplasmata archaeon]|nr:hypothetical protein [Thermoplasmata archaeon]
MTRLLKKGDKLGRAYAGTLLLAVSDKPPSVIIVRLPQGEISIAYWEQTTKDKLIGVQHYDHPVYRLYSIHDLAKKRKLFVYSVDGGMFCSGREPSPPRGFVGMVLKDEGISVVRKEGEYLCHHLEKDWGPHLHIWFASTGEGVRLCPRCLKEDKNTGILLLRRIAGKGVEKDLRAEVDLGVLWGGESKGSGGGRSSLEKRYNIGTLSDQKGFSRAIEEAKNGLIAEGALVAGGKGYENTEELLKALDGTEEEKKALEALLGSISTGVIASEDTANSVLTELWEEGGPKALEAVVKSKVLARNIYDKRSLDDMGPGQIIAEAVMEEKKRKLLSKLPLYKKLGSVSGFADEMARAYRIEGKKG